MCSEAIEFCIRLLIVPRLDFNMEEMLTLRKAGWSSTRLGARYNKDHVTILYHCKKHNVRPQIPKIIHVQAIVFHTKPIPKRQAKPGDKYLDLIDEKVGPTKSYKQYKKESLERAVERKYEDTYGKFR